MAFVTSSPASKIKTMKPLKLSRRTLTVLVQVQVTRQPCRLSAAFSHFTPRSMPDHQPTIEAGQACASVLSYTNTSLVAKRKNLPFQLSANCFGIISHFQGEHIPQHLS
jgi:hypothetical protein